MDVETALWIAGASVAALSAIARWAWVHTHERINQSFTELSGKASNAELLRVRDAQKDTFDLIRDHDKEDRDRHEKIVATMGRLEGKMDALLLRRREGSGRRET